MMKEGVIILLRDPSGRIAWQLRDDDPGVPCAGCWGLFGGWIEPGETPRQAILREMQEELSILLEDSRLEPLGSFTIYPEVTAHIFSYAVADGLRGAVLREGQRFQFLTMDDLSGRPVVPRHPALAEWFLRGNGRPRTGIRTLEASHD